MFATAWSFALWLPVLALWCGLLCWQDARTRRLPNWLTLGGAAMALAVRALAAGTPSAVEGFAAAALAGGVMLLPFLARGAGAGDVKLMFAAGAVVGWRGLFEFLLLTSVAGVVFGMGMILFGYLDHGRVKHYLRSLFDWRYDRRAGRAALLSPDSEKARLPFAIPVSIGLLAVVAMGWT